MRSGQLPTDQPFSDPFDIPCVARQGGAALLQRPTTHGSGSAIFSATERRFFVAALRVTSPARLRIVALPDVRLQ